MNWFYVADSCTDMTDLLTDTTCGSRKEKTYFWQYNTQSKGPKGKRLCRVVRDDDPYVLHDFEDPVFDSELLVRCISLISVLCCPAQHTLIHSGNKNECSTELLQNL